MVVPLMRKSRSVVRRGPRLWIIIATLSVAGLSPAVFADGPEDQTAASSARGFDFVAPGTHMLCLEGYDTIECKSTLLSRDLEDYPPGERLIAVRRYGNHVGARP